MLMATDEPKARLITGSNVVIITQISMSLCNLSGHRLKTRKCNIPECSRRFKQLVFLRLILSRDLAKIQKGVQKL